MARFQTGVQGTFPPLSSKEKQCKNRNQYLNLARTFHDLVVYFLQVMEKSNFKIATDEEIEVALSAQYRLNLPIVVNENKVHLCSGLLRTHLHTWLV